MDLTGWLEFFPHGLATQLQETVERGRRAIKANIVAVEHRRNQRQILATEHLQENAFLNMEQLEMIRPDTTRRSLRRDLTLLIDAGILQSHDEARATRYAISPRYL